MAVEYKFVLNSKGLPAQKNLTIRAYPAISLKDAREARDYAKELLAKGQEPKPDDLFNRGAGSQKPTFQQIAMEWHDLQNVRWSKVHSADVLDNLKQCVFPSIGAIPIDEIDAQAALKMLQAIVKRGAIETAHRTRRRISVLRSSVSLRRYGETKTLLNSQPLTCLTGNNIMALFGDLRSGMQGVIPFPCKASRNQLASIHCALIEHDRLAGRSLRCRQTLQHVDADALVTPPLPAIIERLRRSIFYRRGAPPQPIAAAPITIATINQWGLTLTLKIPR